jgi:hypothetical protein
LRDNFIGFRRGWRTAADRLCVPGHENDNRKLAGCDSGGGCEENKDARYKIQGQLRPVNGFATL